MRVQLRFNVSNYAFCPRVAPAVVKISCHVSVATARCWLPRQLLATTAPLCDGPWAFDAFLEKQSPGVTLTGVVFSSKGEKGRCLVILDLLFLDLPRPLDVQGAMAQTAARCAR